LTIGALDTDSAALATRLDLQHRLSSFDLNGWIFEQSKPKAGEHWLDLGCGRGEQSLPLSRMGCAVTAVDLSAESLAILRQADDRIETIHCGLDEIDLEGRSFDGAVGSYSLYYANDPQRLFDVIARASTRLFFCGPADDNNLELRCLSAEATGEPIEPTRPSMFMEDVAPAICRQKFADVSIDRFENPVRFSTPDELVSYWTSHNLFREPVLPRFRDLAEQHFQRAGEFVNTKRGIGILATRG
jgi:SAM-dependent methyltransferase